MLVLSRHQDESIIIGEGPDAVYVTVLSIRGDKVRLGITAPDTVKADRVEVRDRIERDRRTRNEVSQ